MNEEKQEGQSLIEYRLDQIEKKLDEVTKLLVQTQGQEIRIGVIESQITELKNNKNKGQVSATRYLPILFLLSRFCGDIRSFS